MAVSGSVSTSSYDGRYYTLSWTATQDVSTNKSTVKWTLKAVGGNSSWYAERTLKMTVTSDNALSGAISYSKTSRVERYTGTIKTGTFYVTHDSNGDADFKISLQAAVYTTSVNCTGSKTFTLTNIPRKSTLTVADGVLNTSQTIKVTQKSSSFTHTIVATCGDQSKTICTKSSTLSFSFTPPIAWASENTTGKTVEVTYKITTYNGSTSIGSNSYTVDCDIPSSLVTPSLELAVTDTKGYFEKYGKYIQGQSILEIVATASGLYGATIKSYRTTVDGSTYTSSTATTSVLKGSGTLSLSCVITDSRGFTKTVTESLTVLAYTEPKLTTLTSKRCNADGTSNNSGDYLKVIFSNEVTALENKNTVRVTVQYKKTSETDYTSEEVTAYNDVYTITDGSYIFAADKESTYDITLIVEDAFWYIDRYTTGSSERVLWSRLWKGLGLAIGKFAELEGYLDSGWRIFARKGLKFPLIPSGTDFDTMIETGTYPAGKLSTYNYLNCPNIGDVSFVLEVAEAGPDGELLQRIVTVEDEPKTLCRSCANDTWGDWIDKVSELNSNFGLFTAYLTTDFTLSNTKANIPLTLLEQSNDFFQINSDGNIEVLKECMANISISGYLTTNFTANDIIHLELCKNDNVLISILSRANSALPYEHIAKTQNRLLTAGDVLTLNAYNQTGARGIIGKYASNTYVSIIAINRDFAIN